jgi:hypothetical protein
VLTDERSGSNRTRDPKPETITSPLTGNTITLYRRCNPPWFQYSNTPMC